MDRLFNKTQRLSATGLAQEAWLQAFLSLDTLRDDSRFRSWLYGIALNVSRACIRAQLRGGFSRTLSIDELAGGVHREPAAYGASPEQIVERSVLRHRPPLVFNIHILTRSDSQPTEIRNSLS